MPTLYKDGKTCVADQMQVNSMKKAGWSLSPDSALADFGLDDEPVATMTEPEPELEIEPELDQEVSMPDTSRMRKQELIQLAREHGYDVDNTWTVAQLREVLS